MNQTHTHPSPGRCTALDAPLACRIALVRRLIRMAQPQGQGSGRNPGQSSSLVALLEPGCCWAWRGAVSPLLTRRTKACLHIRRSPWPPPPHQGASGGQSRSAAVVSAALIAASHRQGIARGALQPCRQWLWRHSPAAVRSALATDSAVRNAKPCCQAAAPWRRWAHCSVAPPLSPPEGQSMTPPHSSGRHRGRLTDSQRVRHPLQRAGLSLLDMGL